MSHSSKAPLPGFLLIPFFLLLTFTSACSTTELVRKQDYMNTRSLYKTGDYESARRRFPNKEDGGFITTLEKSWLELLYDQPDTDELMQLSKDVEQRQVIYVSKEAKYFFYQETEDGYYPAEHEVVWLHILTGLAFAKQQEREKACVETRKAGLYLRDQYDPNRGRFDDPSLRMMLAGLWLYCGDWEQARVDFRIAARLSENSAELKKLAERARPPASLALAWVGTGPEVQWKDKGSLTEKAGTEALEFHSRPRLSSFHLNLASLKDPLGSPFETSWWYERHKDRNTAIREVLQDSKYMVKAGALGTLNVTSKAASKLAAATFMTAGITAGLVIGGGGAYLVAQAGATGSGELIGSLLLLGFAIGEYSVNEAIKFDREAQENADEFTKKSLNQSETYRFVRFLPEALYSYAGSVPLQTDEVLTDSFGESYRPFLALKSPDKATSVLLYHVP